MIMCLFPHCQFVCRLIGEVDCDGGGSVCIFFCSSHFVYRLVGEVQCGAGMGGGTGYDNVSFSPQSLCVQISW